MKIVDLYEEDSFLNDRDAILKWINKSFKEFDPDKLKIESDGLIYDGDLVINSLIYVNTLKVLFKSVSGWFDYNQSKIISLKGSPKTVGSYFSCNNTSIDSLEFCPHSVSGDFYCSRTNITSLKYCPKLVGHDFHCHNIKITDLKEYRFALYCEIGGTFYSSNVEINDIINTYGGPNNRKHWPNAINLLSKV